MLVLLLIVLALVAFILATVGVALHPRFSLVPAGLALLVVAYLCHTFGVTG